MSSPALLPEADAQIALPRAAGALRSPNAPPWGSEVRLTRPNIGPFNSPFAGTGVPNPFPITFDASAPFSPNGPFLSFPSDLTNTRVHNWNVAVQRQIGSDMAVSASYIGNYTTNLWDVVTGNPGTIPGGNPAAPCTLRLPTGATQTFTPCQSAPLDLRREISQADPTVGRFIGFLDYFTDTGTQKYNGLLLQVQQLVCPARVRDLLGLKANPVMPPALAAYRWSRLLRMDSVLKPLLYPAAYQRQIRELDRH